MIYIDLTNFVLSDELRYEAWQLNSELMAKATIAEKIEFIDNNRLFWSKLKAVFPMNTKCWYSEAKESVSPYDIEHFRPTKAVARSKSIAKKLKSFAEENRKDWTKQTKFKGTGYWWLAFNYLNYRNCGRKLNNTKGIRFPLKPVSFIAYNEKDQWEREDVILLDPLIENDCTLLSFDPDGKARPTFTDVNSYEYSRAFITIEIFGLNKIDSLVVHRETKWADCYKAIKRAKEKYIELENAVEADNKVQFDRYFNEFLDFVNNDIKPAIQRDSEFSSVAKACVSSYSSYEWINKYVLND